MAATAATADAARDDAPPAAPAPTAGGISAAPASKAVAARAGAPNRYEYVDDGGCVRGPYSLEQMGTWLSRRLLLPNRRARVVRRAHAAPVAVDGERAPHAEAVLDARPFEPIVAIAELAPFCAADDLEAARRDAAPLVGEGGAKGALGGFVYIDAAGREQGPFELGHMRAWAAAGALPSSTLVRRAAGGTEHVSLGAWPELRDACPAVRAPSAPLCVAGIFAPPARELTEDEKRLEAALDRAHGAGSSMPPAPVCSAPPAPRAERGDAIHAGGLAQPAGGGAGADYAVRGAFNARTGRFVVTDGTGADAHWERKGLPADRAGRQLAHYFEVGAWQRSKAEESERKRRRQHALH